MRSLFNFMLFFLLLQLVASFDAIADESEPVFISTSGRDSGNCVESACRSIDFAISKLGKNDTVRLSTGQFEFSHSDTLFAVLSGNIKLVGGFDPVTGKPGNGQTTLTGIPAAFRARFENMGFRVITDTKSSASHTLEVQTLQSLKTQSSLQQGLSASECVSGQVEGLSCDRVELVAHVPLEGVSTSPGNANDIWGFIDLNTFREYAIVGYNLGAAVFDISDPENPREVGFVDGQSASWRDVKIHQRFNADTAKFEAYAYVTTDGVGDGLFVVDLTALPHRIERVNFSSDFNQAHNLFIANTDYATGLQIIDKTPALVIAGSSTGTGSIRNYSLDTPRSPSLIAAPNPSVIGCGSKGCYSHDVASMVIRDSRISQCPNATDHCEVLFDFNESSFDLWDITDSGDPIRLSRTSYTAVRYTHSGWASEDGMTLFVQDELDEKDGFVTNTTLRSFDLSNLAAPSRSGGWEGPTNSIDHNGFVRGNRYYMSNYEDGLSILDITNPDVPERVGFLDTYPFGAPTQFEGAWGAYPFFPSGLIGISDRNSGLYLIRDQSLDVPAGSLAFSAPAYGVEESSSVDVRVSRQGGSDGAISARYEIHAVTADSSDVSIGSGVLTWLDGEAGDKIISVAANTDPVDEGLEHLFVRLLSPAGGATLNFPNMTSVYISERSETATLQFATSTLSVTERQQFASAAITIQRSGSALGASQVDYLIQGVTAEAGSDFSANLSGTLIWDDGDARPKTVEILITDDNLSEPDESFSVSLLNPLGAILGPKSTIEVTIAEGNGSNAAPVAIAGAAQTVRSGSRVTLNGSASTDSDGDTLSYVWTQTLGPAVTLSNATSPSASFTAPTVTADSLLQFSLTVSDPSGSSDQASVSITVEAATGSTQNGGGGGGSSFALTLLVLMAALLRRSIQHRRKACST